VARRRSEVQNLIDQGEIEEGGADSVRRLPGLTPFGVRLWREKRAHPVNSIL
jgi:hypothetical protein